jgi:hypothetical protein
VCLRLENILVNASENNLFSSGECAFVFLTLHSLLFSKFIIVTYVKKSIMYILSYTQIRLFIKSSILQYNLKKVKNIYYKNNLSLL